MMINQILYEYDAMLDNVGLNDKSKVLEALRIVLSKYRIEEVKSELAVAEDTLRAKALRMFFISKKIEGCTDETLKYYSTILTKFFLAIPKNLQDIEANDIRYYIATLSIKGLSKVTQDNELRVLKSFFKFAIGEQLITNLPTANIKGVKQEKRIKKPFTELQIETMRKHLASSKNLRNIAIFETLLSTGVRVTELIGMNIDDIEEDEVVVFGKGEKERVVYLNAKAKLSIDEYLSSRTDKNPALFVDIRKPFGRLTKGAVETMIRNLGKECGVLNAHPHRFRRTTATLSLNRGMPIEQVSKMLGHEKIETTTIYARTEQEIIKSSHKKYVT